MSQRVVGAQKKVILKLRKISCADKWEANKNLSNSKHTSMSRLSVDILFFSRTSIPPVGRGDNDAILTGKYFKVRFAGGNY